MLTRNICTSWTRRIWLYTINRRNIHCTANVATKIPTSATNVASSAPGGQSCGEILCNNAKYKQTTTATTNYWKQFGVTCMLILTGYFGYKHKHRVLPIAFAATIDTGKQSNRQKYNFFADIVEVVRPTVVYIEIKDKRHFDYYSGQPMTASNGSGFIVDSNGLILTNAHVVINKPHTFVQVRLQDGRTFTGKVETVDPTSDLATIRIDCKNLPTIKLGTSSDLRAGEWVVALGSPLALNNTVTAGVVSSTQRNSKDLGLHGRNIDYIQTDAAITFGNSGGPLINLDGEAIGINSMKVTTGISFAIPIDYAKLFLQKSKQIRSQKSSVQESSRRYMGITMLTLTDDILLELRQRSHTMPADLKNGVIIWKVISGSPAHAGGLDPGDIVTHINGKPVLSTSDVYAALSEKGKPLEIDVYRGLKKITVVIIPEEVE